MYKISEIISIPIISLYESEFHGIIYNIMFDPNKRKVKYACILDENDGIKKLLNMSNIYHIGKDCIFIKNKNPINLQCGQECILSNYISGLNLPIYNTNGQLLGISSDIEIDEKYNIKHLILNNGTTIEGRNIIKLGKSIILVSDSSFNINKFKPKRKTLIQNSCEKKVYILSNDELNSQKTNTKSSVNKIITNYNFLIGRKTNKDILAPNGELVAKKDIIITKQILNQASLYGKLVELARYSTKKLTN